MFSQIFIVALAISAVLPSAVFANVARLHLPRDHRIVGGEEAVPHEVPSILNLGYHSCAATLIHPKWALTAAHCIPIREVVAGDHDIKATEGTEQKRKVIRNISHPKYGRPITFSNDVALLELESPFELNDYVQIAKLPKRRFSPTGMALVAGWGIDEEGNLPNKLQKVKVPLMSRAECRRKYLASGYDIDTSMICAGIIDKDSCQGDSGGPLYCDSEEGQVHCGVVSWGHGCGLDGFPGVYARTSEFIDFIESNLGEDFV